MKQINFQRQRRENMTETQKKGCEWIRIDPFKGSFIEFKIGIPEERDE